MATVTKTPVQPKLKAWISDFTVRFEALSLRGRITSIPKPKARTSVSYVLTSPDGNPCKRIYIDAVTNLTYESEEDLNRTAVNEDGDTVSYTKAEMEALRASELPKNVISLTCHHAAEVERALYPEAVNGYVFEPHDTDPANKKYHDAIVAALLADPSKTFLGLCNFHGHEGLFRMSVWRGRLVFHKQLFANQINDYATVTPQVPAESVAAIVQVLNKRVKPFDGDAYQNNVLERQRKALADPTGFKLPDLDAPAEIELDMAAMLASLGMLDANGDTPPAKKSRAKKVKV